ncbi:MAG: hypothetical protein ABIJ27_07275 [Candidatus Omnitrophota bacterium]
MTDARLIARSGRPEARAAHIGARVFVRPALTLLIILSSTVTLSAETIHQTDSDRFYVNEDYGFSIVCPPNWNIHIEPPIKGTLALFNKSRSYEDALPSIVLLVDDIRERFNSSSGFAQAVISDYASRGNIVLEPVSNVEIGDVKGVKFTTEYSVDGKGNALRMTQYVFEKEDFVISVLYAARKDDFERYRKEFKKALLQFSFIKPEDDFMTLTRLTGAQIAFKSVEPEKYRMLKREVVNTMDAMSSFKSMFIVKNKADERFASNGYLRWEWEMVFNAPDDFEVRMLNFYNNVGDTWRVVGGNIYSKIGEWIPMPMVGDPEALKGYIKARREIYTMLSFRRYLTILENSEPLAVGADIGKEYTVVRFHLWRANDLFTGKPRAGVFTTDIFLWVANHDTTIRLARTVITGEDETGKKVSEEYDHYFSSFNAPFVLGVPEIRREKTR